eukprot:gnl/TRDRNA2_/TRDRNA2_137049_c0_seq1.p1 gnl/TRDRNA2_/TRDRNA2_137049_c0~~gnl/TRDRNA2_/TRDRNA2_137049_c0_seq1.p1  ORF type:complete len:286 (+),score=12.49 gnl/TRDRNA2_/TRDRNA2_137049_c0_seq1:115-972(+)
MAAKSEQIQPRWRCRPSVSAGSGLVEDAAVHAEELDDLRTLRARAYRHRHRSGCGGIVGGSRCGRLFLPCRIVLCVVCSVVSLLRCTLSAIAAIAWAILSSFFQPQFWLGVLLTLLVLSGLALTHCTEQAPMAVDQGQAVRVLCMSDHPWASEVRSVAISAIALLREVHVFAHRLAWMGSTTLEGRWAHDAFEVVVGTILGTRCPFRSPDDALAKCTERWELQSVRRAIDCAALRRAHHDGQRQFHPDHLRLRHPSCSSEVLQSCSVALNLALESRRAELNCPAR